MMFKFVVIGALMVASTLAAPATENAEVTKPTDAIDCANEDFTLCLRLNVIRTIRNAVRSPEMQLADGIKLVGTAESQNSRAKHARSLSDIESTLPKEPEARDAAVNQALIDEAKSFLTTHTLELSLPKEVSRAFDEARGKKGLKKLPLALLLLLKLKSLVLIPVALIGLALLAVKALVVGKLALLISGLLGLQKLGGAKHTNYDVVAHPVHEHHDHHGWSQRSSGSDLAYSSYKPAE